MQSIQYNSYLIVTGAIRGTSKEKFYQELGLESLQLCRSYRKPSLFYEVFKNKHPKGPFNLISVRSTSYGTRTVGNIPLLRQSIIFSKIIFLHLLLLNKIT